MARIRAILGENEPADVVGILAAKSHISDSDCIYFQDFPHLKSLNLNETQITDAGLCNVRCLTELRDYYAVQDATCH